MNDCPHGLDTRWCAACLDRTRPKPATAPIVPGRSFPAQYPGPCAACDDRIGEGDLIAWSTTDDGYVHDGCA